jgi:hypothetical protein
LHKSGFLHCIEGAGNAAKKPRPNLNIRGGFLILMVWQLLPAGLFHLSRAENMDVMWILTGFAGKYLLSCIFFLTAALFLGKVTVYLARIQVSFEEVHRRAVAALDVFFGIYR